MCFKKKNRKEKLAKKKDKEVSSGLTEASYADANADDVLLKTMGVAGTELMDEEPVAEASAPEEPAVEETVAEEPASEEPVAEEASAATADDGSIQVAYDAEGNGYYVSYDPETGNLYDPYEPETVYDASAFYDAEGNPFDAAAVWGLTPSEPEAETPVEEVAAEPEPEVPAEEAVVEPEAVAEPESETPVEEVAAEPEPEVPSEELTVEPEVPAEEAMVEPEVVAEPEPEATVEEVAAEPEAETLIEEPSAPVEEAVVAPEESSADAEVIVPDATHETEPDAPFWQKYVGNDEYGYFDENSDWNWTGYFDEEDNWHKDTETVEAAPEPVVEPEAVVEPAPEPVVEVSPEPEVEPEPAVEVEQEAVVEAAPEPAVEAVPEPVLAHEEIVEAAPESVVETAPESVVETAPESVVETAPEPVVEAYPEPVVEPEHVAEVEQEAVVETAPEPVVEPEPEAVESALVPDMVPEAVPANYEVIPTTPEPVVEPEEPSAPTVFTPEHVAEPVLAVESETVVVREHEVQHDFVPTPVEPEVVVESQLEPVVPAVSAAGFTVAIADELPPVAPVAEPVISLETDYQEPAVAYEEQRPFDVTVMQTPVVAPVASAPVATDEPLPPVIEPTISTPKMRPKYQNSAYDTCIKELNSSAYTLAIADAIKANAALIRASETGFVASATEYYAPSLRSEDQHTTSATGTTQQPIPEEPQQELTMSTQTSESVKITQEASPLHEPTLEAKRRHQQDPLLNEHMNSVTAEVLSGDLSDVTETDIFEIENYDEAIKSSLARIFEFLTTSRHRSTAIYKRVSSELRTEIDNLSRATEKLRAEYKENEQQIHRQKSDLIRALSSSVDGSSKKATAAKEFESLSHTQEYNRHLARTIKENTQRLSVLKNNLNVLREIYEKRIVRISSDIYKMQRIVATLTASQRSYNLLEGSFDSMRRAQDDYQSVLNTYDPIGVDGLLDSTPGLVPFRRSPLESYRSALGRYDRGSKYGSLYDKYELSPDRTTSLDSYTSSFDTVGLDDEYKF